MFVDKSVSFSQQIDHVSTRHGYDLNFSDSIQLSLRKFWFWLNWLLTIASKNWLKSTRDSKWLSRIWFKSTHHSSDFPWNWLRINSRLKQIPMYWFKSTHHSKEKHIWFRVDLWFNSESYLCLGSTIISRHTGFIARVSFCLDKSTTRLLYNSLIFPYLILNNFVSGWNYTSQLNKLPTAKKNSANDRTHLLFP